MIVFPTLKKKNELKILAGYFRWWPTKTEEERKEINEKHATNRQPLRLVGPPAKTWSWGCVSAADVICVLARDWI